MSRLLSVRVQMPCCDILCRATGCCGVLHVATFCNSAFATTVLDQSLLGSLRMMYASEASFVMLCGLREKSHGNTWYG